MCSSRGGLKHLRREPEPDQRTRIKASLCQEETSPEPLGNKKLTKQQNGRLLRARNSGLSDQNVLHGCLKSQYLTVLKSIVMLRFLKWTYPAKGPEKHLIFYVFANAHEPDVFAENGVGKLA